VCVCVCVREGKRSPAVLLVRCVERAGRKAATPLAPRPVRRSSPDQTAGSRNSEPRPQVCSPVSNQRKHTSCLRRYRSVDVARGSQGHTHTHTHIVTLFLLWNVLLNLISSLWIFYRVFYLEIPDTMRGACYLSGQAGKEEGKGSNIIQSVQLDSIYK